MYIIRSGTFMSSVIGADGRRHDIGMRGRGECCGETVRNCRCRRAIELHTNRYYSLPTHRGVHDIACAVLAPTLQSILQPHYPSLVGMLVAQAAQYDGDVLLGAM